MTMNKIAAILNSTLVPNLLGESVTISEDLSNIIDLGKAISAISADELKDITNTFVQGVAKTYYDDRLYSKVLKGLFKDYTEYGGIIQRVKSGLMTVSDDESKDLSNGVTYDPNVYNGISLDNKIYQKDCSFQLAWSVPQNMFKEAFMTADGVMKLVAYITNRAENTINTQLHALELTVLRALIAQNATKRIKLVTTYNAAYGKTLTASTAVKDVEFLKWATGLIINLKKSITDYGKRYNDGTIDTFTPESDINVTLLSLFATDLQVNMTSEVFNKELVSIGNFETVNFFQNSGDAQIPTYAVAGSVDTKIEGGAQVTIDNVVGVIYDSYAAGITAHAEKVTSQYNGRGDFVNYWSRQYANYFIDSRANSIILTLE